jgi:aubergine
MWPGYLTQSRLLADGIFLNVDTAAKFIKKTTVLEWINRELEKGKTREQIAAVFDSSNLDVPRKTVITSYNIRSYQIDGLDWDQNPKTHFFELKKGDTKKEISMKDYMAQQYKVNLRENN